MVNQLYADVASMGGFVQKENLKTSIHDSTIFPTTPIPPDNNPTLTIVTVPATNPVNPAAPITNPATTPAPVTVPGGAQPVTNPVTTYPPPSGNVPVTPPATTNAPAIPGQSSWCVAKTGVSDTTLQQALDYACGIGGADCSLIQQGGSCYNPNSLQNHASYAFNSYYQKNPSPTSCDFGGIAMIVNTNPSTGSCVYPSSSSSSTPPAQPASSTPPAATTTTPPGPGIPGSVNPPGMLNSSNPALVFGSDSPPSVSTSAGSQLILSSLTLVIFFVTEIIILQI